KADPRWIRIGERLSQIANRTRIPSMTRVCTPWLLAISVLAQAPDAPTPTIKPSQHGSVTQQVAATKMTVEYNRPVARGRDLFGALVPYDRVWCPGADDCTTLTV